MENTAPHGSTLNSLQQMKLLKTGSDWQEVRHPLARPPRSCSSPKTFSSRPVIKQGHISLAEVPGWIFRDYSRGSVYGIHFTGDAAEASIGFSVRLGNLPNWDNRPSRKEFAEAIKLILDKAALRKGKAELRREDIYAIRRKWEEH